EYFENTGNAVARLSWRRPSQTTYAVIPQAQLYEPPPTGNGLLATYFDDVGFTGNTVHRRDATVNFSWGNGAPIAGIGPDTFSVRWTGKIQAMESGDYSFRTVSNDGVRLWVNGELIIDRWTAHPTTAHTGTISLVTGQQYDIQLEYYE